MYISSAKQSSVLTQSELFDSTNTLSVSCGLKEWRHSEHESMLLTVFLLCRIVVSRDIPHKDTEAILYTFTTNPFSFGVCYIGLNCLKSIKGNTERFKLDLNSKNVNSMAVWFIYYDAPLVQVNRVVLRFLVHHQNPDDKQKNSSVDECL